MNNLGTLDSQTTWVEFNSWDLQQSVEITPACDFLKLSFPRSQTQHVAKAILENPCPVRCLLTLPKRIFCDQWPTNGRVSPKASSITASERNQPKGVIRLSADLATEGACSDGQAHMAQGVQAPGSFSVTMAMNKYLPQTWPGPLPACFIAFVIILQYFLSCYFIRRNKKFRSLSWPLTKQLCHLDLLLLAFSSLDCRFGKVYSSIGNK